MNGPNIVMDGLKVQVDFGNKNTFDPVPTSLPLALDSSTNIINTAPNTGNVLGDASPESPFTYYSLFDKNNGGNINGDAGSPVFHISNSTAIVTSAGAVAVSSKFGSRKISVLGGATNGDNADVGGWENMVMGNYYYLEHTSGLTQYEGFFKYVDKEAVTWNPAQGYTLQGQMLTSETNAILNTPNENALYPGDILQINNEKMRVLFHLNPFGTGDTWRVERAVEGTERGFHNSGDAVQRIKSTYLYRHAFEWVASHNKFQSAQRVNFSVAPINNGFNIYEAEQVGVWGYEGRCIANEYSWSSGAPVDGWVNINHNQNYDVSTDPFTIEVWFRMRDLPTADYGDGTPIYGNRQGSNYALFCYPKDANNKSSMGACYDDSRYSSVHKSVAQIGQMEWVQFVHCHHPYSGIRGQFEYYVNGELDTPLTTSADSSGFSVPNTLAIGHDFRYNVQSRIDMAIIRHYDRVLTPAEVKQNFNANRGRFGL